MGSVCSSYQLNHWQQLTASSLTLTPSRGDTRLSRSLGEDLVEKGYDFPQKDGAHWLGMALSPGHRCHFLLHQSQALRHVFQQWAGEGDSAGGCHPKVWVHTEGDRYPPVCTGCQDCSWKTLVEWCKDKEVSAWRVSPNPGSGTSKGANLRC